jgi:hypothetical protein
MRRCQFKIILVHKQLLLKYWKFWRIVFLSLVISSLQFANIESVAAMSMCSKFNCLGFTGVTVGLVVVVLVDEDGGELLLCPS